jgi:hypothetical protein
VKTLDSKSKIQLVPYAKAYPPTPKGFGANAFAREQFALPI